VGAIAYSQPAPAGRIVVMHQGALGDFLLALPVLEALHHSNPLIRLALWSKTEHLALLAQKPYVESLHPPSDGELVPFFHDDLWQAARIPDCLKDAQAMLVFGQAGSRVLCKRLSSRLSYPVYWFQSFPPPGIRQHVCQFHLEQCRRLGWLVEEGLPELRPSQDDVSCVRTRLRQKDPTALDRPILIHPGSGGLAKVWPVANWWTLIRFLRESCRRPVVLTLGPADERLRDFAHEAEVLGVLTVESPSLPILTAWLSLSRLYVGSDSGVSHLAALVGIPSIVVFGPTDPEIWGPRGPHVHIMRQSWEASEVLKTPPSAAVRSLTAPVIRLAERLLSTP